MESAPSSDRLHHLTLDKRGRWIMRVTVDQGAIVVGKTVRTVLGKCSEGEAIRRRDSHLRTLKSAGVPVKLRHQKRKL